MDIDEIQINTQLNSSSNDLNLEQQQLDLTAVHANADKRASMFKPRSNYNMSSSSLAESNTCLTHQYHYIQYHPAQQPAYYQQFHAQQHAMPQKASATTNSIGAAATTCHCPCSCGILNQSMRSPVAQAAPTIMDSQMAVAVIVHRQASTTNAEHSVKTQSEQSLLNHSYQALELQTENSNAEEKPLNVLGNSKLNVSCDCDLECTCGVNSGVTDASSSTPTGAGLLLTQKHKQSLADAMLGIDEITVSESDNNSTMLKKKKGRNDCSHSSKKFNSWCAHDSNIFSDKNYDSNYNSSHPDIYSDGEDKIDADANLADNRPPLPPRPPRTRGVVANASAHRHGNGIRKYVVWCLICGGFSCLLGVLFLGVYFLLHSYTITVGNFETVPTFVPATLLILTGLCIMSLARRRNRYSYLIKLSGACGLISALTCALVTVTTTVLHMSRLQALRECEYAQKTRTCTCYSDMIESQVDRVDKEGVRLVFDSLSDCGVVHGSLYSCLRAIFGLSVAGVLIAVFSCMLVYQLLSHERKKMYWEQLELRCRSLYTSQQGPPPNMAAAAAAGARSAAVCRCCEQCHAHRQMPLQATAYPWDDGGEPRFWTGQPPGNFYSPNPGGDDMHVGTATVPYRSHTNVARSGRVTTGWSWPRMPWQRSSPDPSSRFRQTPSSPDSQYGFTNNMPVSAENIIAEDLPTAQQFTAQHFNVVNTANLPYWGPPPPYSDPNSPARRGYYYIQPNVCNNGNSNIASERPMNATLGNEQHMMSCLNHHRSAFLEPQTGVVAQSACCAQTSSMRQQTKRQASGVGTVGGVSGKTKAAGVVVGGGDYENTPSESDGGARDRFSNTLPTPRKLKKRVEAGAKSIGPNTQTTQRVSVQQIFSVDANYTTSENDGTSNERDYAENTLNANLSDEANTSLSPSCNNTARMLPCKQTPRQKRSGSGIENNAYQSANNNDSGGVNQDVHEACVGDPTESEVYFADVSSCCNMSVKNDNYYEDTNQTNAVSHHAHIHTHGHPHHHHHHQHQSSNCSHNSSSSTNNNNNEDYLAQRFGQRENSIRSRLPFPQVRPDDYEENLNITSTQAANPAPTHINNQMQKEISRQSMCSIESEAKTEFTDLSPATPCSNKFVQAHFATAAAQQQQQNSNKMRCSLEESRDTAATRSGTVPPPPNFVASFPYSSESQSLEAHRRSTKDIHELMLTTEAHYEVINEPPTQFGNMHGSKSSERINNLMGSSVIAATAANANKRATTDNIHKSKTKSKSRERLDTPTNVYAADMEWSDTSNDRQLL